MGTPQKEDSAGVRLRGCVCVNASERECVCVGACVRVCVVCGVCVVCCVCSACAFLWLYQCLIQINRSHFLSVDRALCWCKNTMVPSTITHVVLVRRSDIGVHPLITHASGFSVGIAWLLEVR